MPLAPVVMKFGGTSVQDPEAVGRLIAIVRSARDEARAAGRSGPAVVVSALSTVTDRLLSVADKAATGALADAGRDIAALRDRHLAMLVLVRAAAARAALEAAIARQFDELASLARALDVLGEVSPRSRDAIASIGELVSSRVIAQALSDAGVPATWVDARQVLVTNDSFGSAVPNGPETQARLYAHVDGVLADGRVPVIGGYVGGTPAGVATTLGRGGSDYSAAIFGAALGAAEIQIWTDVDGMLTGDPRLVAHPRVVSRLSFDEASELAYFGAKVLHPSTIQPAVAQDIPVRILNARNPAHPGHAHSRHG